MDIPDGDMNTSGGVELVVDSEETKERTPEDNGQNNGTSPIDSRPPLEARPSFRLRQAWPQSVLGEIPSEGRDPQLVVCTLDVQVLTDTLQVMHSQIDIMRATIMDLRSIVNVHMTAEDKEIGDIRSKLVALEEDAARPGQSEQGGTRMVDIETRIKELQLQRTRLKTQGDKRDQEIATWQDRLKGLEAAVWGGSIDSTSGTKTPADVFDEIAPTLETTSNPPDGEEKTVIGPAAYVERSLPDPLEKTDTGTEETPEEDGTTPGESRVKRRRMKSITQTVMLVGGMALCPNVQTLREQFTSILEGDRAARLGERVAALEMGLAMTTERRKKLLRRLLRQAVLLRKALLVGGNRSAEEEGYEGVRYESMDEDGSCWAEETEATGNLTPEHSGEKESNEEGDLRRARARLAWLESNIEQVQSMETLELQVSTDNVHGVPSGHKNASATRESDADSSFQEGDGIHTDDGESKLEGVPAVLDIPQLWESGEEKKAGVVSRKAEEDEVERLWGRMDDVECRIYQMIASRRERLTQGPAENSVPAVTESNLQELRSSLELSSSALETRLQKSLASLNRRIDSLEESFQSAHSQAASETEEKVVDDHALVHVEPTLPKALDDEMPMMRHQLEGITDRVVALETANLDKASKSDLLSVEQAVNAAAAVAVGEANEETQGRLMAEISALEERIDRRAHDEAMRAKEEKAAVEARGSIRRVSTTISAYTADLAQRLEVLQSEHAKQGAEVSRAAEEIAAAEADLKDLGSELVGLGQVANNVATVVDAKADQTDVEALKLMLQRLNATVSSKTRGASTARDAEAIAALQAAFKDMSSSMEGSMRKLQQAQASAGSIKLQPLLDRVMKELTSAGLLADQNSQGAIGRSLCLSCNRPMSVTGSAPPTSKFATQFRGTLGARMETAMTPPLPVNTPAVVWRGGFKMPPRKPNQGRGRTPTQGTPGEQGIRRAQTGNSGAGVGYVHSSLVAVPDMQFITETSGTAKDRLPGIPNILDSGGGGIEGGIEGLKAGKAAVGSLRVKSDAPHRARFVQDGSNKGPRSMLLSSRRM